MSKRLDLHLSLLLLLLTALVYWPVTHHEFLNYDDHLYVTDNPAVQDGLTIEGVKWAFRTFSASNWHPVTWLSHMADCSLFFLYPAGHHLTNLLFHLANAVLLFQFLRRLTSARWRCALVAALFAWHPLHVESVAWVAERKDVLSTFFLILALWAYLRYAERPGLGRYLGVLGLFALGLMSKPMLVTVPFLLLLLDYWPLRRFRPSLLHPTVSPDASDGRRVTGKIENPVQVTQEHAPEKLESGHERSWFFLVWEKVPFFALSLGSSVLTLCAQEKSGAMKTLEAVPLFSRILNAITSYAAYLYKMFWPADLAVFYPLRSNVSAGWTIGSALILAGISFFAWRRRQQHPFLLVGWLWYLGSLVPVIGLIQVGGQSMADRYTYVPFLGLFIMAAWGLAEWATRHPKTRRLLTIGCVTVLLALWGATSLYLRSWQNSRTLFEHALKVTRDNFVAEHNLGVALKNEGKTLEAMPHYFEAVRINPSFATAHFNLAINLAELGQIPQALFHFSEVERLKMDSAEKHNIFGVALAKRGRFDEAVSHFSTAASRDPFYPKTHYNLAYAFSEQGKTAEAIDAYRDALRLQPQWPEALQSLAWLLATHQSDRFRDGPEAVRLAERACELTRWRHPGYLDTLAAAYAEAKRPEEAVATAEKALELAKSARQPELAADIQSRLKLYRTGKAFRQTTAG